MGGLPGTPAQGSMAAETLLITMLLDILPMLRWSLFVHMVDVVHWYSSGPSAQRTCRRHLSRKEDRIRGQHQRHPRVPGTSRDFEANVRMIAMR